MIIGDRSEIYAELFQSGGLWHFTIHKMEHRSVIYSSRFVDGHADKGVAMSHASDLVQEFKKAS